MYRTDRLVCQYTGACWWSQHWWYWCLTEHFVCAHVCAFVFARLSLAFSCIFLFQLLSDPCFWALLRKTQLVVRHKNYSVCVLVSLVIFHSFWTLATHLCIFPFFVLVVGKYMCTYMCRASCCCQSFFGNCHASLLFARCIVVLLDWQVRSV